MNFVSLEFLGFFALVYAAYWSIGADSWRCALLVVASYLFYAAWDWRYCALMLFVTANAYVAGLLIGRSRHGGILGFSIALSLGLLAAFKYWDFLGQSTESAFAALGYRLHVPIPHWLLPVGISFYTFHAISYVVDVYRGKVSREPNPARVGLYIAFFPQLIAGPITRASFFLPQLRVRRSFLRTQQAQGVALFLRGLLYKAVFADSLAAICDPPYHAVQDSSARVLVNAAFAFYGQIYFDFAGYSLMAIGAARLLGYRLPRNFNYPYVSLSVTEFWRRWHMSLSFWLRDYVYISLGGNRGSWPARYRNIMVTMLLGGLWHGAAWTFVVWGALHGLGLCLHKLWLEAKARLGLKPMGTCGVLLALLITQAWVLVAWIFFRATTFSDAWTVLLALGNWQVYRDLDYTDATVWVVFLIVLDHALGLAKPVRVRLPLRIAQPTMWFGLGAAAAVALALMAQTQKPFIYFQF